jgi:hypothetical protein
MGTRHLRVRTDQMNAAAEDDGWGGGMGTAMAIDRFGPPHLVSFE